MRSRRLPRWIRLLIVLFVLLLPAAGGFAIYIMLDKPASGTVDASVMPFSAESTLVPFNDTILVSDAAFLYCFARDGTKLWEYPLEYQNSSFRADNQMIALWSGQSLRLLDANGHSIFGGTMLRDITEVRCGNSMFALLSNDGVIYVFDSSGVALDTIEQSGVTVLDYAFYNQGNLLWVLSLDTGGTSPVSHVSTYEPNRLMTSGNKYTDQIVYRALFYQNDIAYVGSRTLYQNSEGGALGKTTETLVYGWELLDDGVSKDRIAMVFAPATQIAEGKLDRLKFICGQETQEIKAVPDCAHVRLGQKGIYQFTRDRIVFQSFSGETRTLTSVIPIDDVIALFSDDSILITSGSKVYILTQ